MDLKTNINLKFRSNSHSKFSYSSPSLKLKMNSFQEIKSNNMLLGTRNIKHYFSTTPHKIENVLSQNMQDKIKELNLFLDRLLQVCYIAIVGLEIGFQNLQKNSSTEIVEFNEVVSTINVIQQSMIKLIKFSKASQSKLNNSKDNKELCQIIEELEQRFKEHDLYKVVKPYEEFKELESILRKEHDFDTIKEKLILEYF
jgi:hypothetical protein